VRRVFEIAVSLACVGSAAGGYACWLQMSAAEGWRAWAWGGGFACCVVGAMLNGAMVQAMDRDEMLTEKRRRRGIPDDE
jgi:hypothetical protein